MGEREKSSGEIYKGGSEARTKGAIVGANPYPSASPEFTAWDRGWRSDDPNLSDLPLDQHLAVETPTG
jgi:hypothetical protein